jgi:hypothetical protein
MLGGVFYIPPRLGFPAIQYGADHFGVEFDWALGHGSRSFCCLM